MAPASHSDLIDGFYENHPAVISWSKFFVERFMPTVDDEHRRMVAEDQKYCLLDSIAFWIEKGDGVSACGTFENYVVIVASIITAFDQHVRDLHGQANPGIGALEYPTKKLRHYSLKTLRIAPPSQLPHMHAAFSRAAWDLAVVAHAQRTAATTQK